MELFIRQVPAVKSSVRVLSVTLISCIPCCFMNHEKTKECINVKWTNKWSKTLFSVFLPFFLFYITRLIKNSSLQEIDSLKEVYDCLYKSLPESDETFLYIKLHQTRCLYIHFLLSFFRLSCSHSSHSLRLCSLGFSSSSLTLL